MIHGGLDPADVLLKVHDLVADREVVLLEIELGLVEVLLDVFLVIFVHKVLPRPLEVIDVSLNCHPKMLGL